MNIRFDSLTPGEPDRSLRFGRQVGQVVAREVGEVMPALAEVEAAAARGLFAAGYVAYEAAPAMDPALRARDPVPGLPLLAFGFFEEAIEGIALEGLDDEREYRLSPLDPALDSIRYEEGVRQILDLIAAGDTYQVNFTFPMRGTLTGSPASLYRDLCLAQRSGYCALLDIGRFSILSASPELFFCRSGDETELKPMKGTIPRGRWVAEDADLADQLARSAKDRAENLMIVDLLRNDLGRVATVGSVEVAELYRIEPFPTVHQMTSSITGRLRPDVGVPEIFRALFPSGSVTGAPKIRTSEIIADLETEPRGVYTGAIGFVGGEDAVFSVAIRTLLLDRDSGHITLGVGSGITADSDPAREYVECLTKSAFVEYRAPDFQILESLRLEAPTGYPLVARHLDRMAESADYFGFSFDRGAAEATLEAVAAGAPSGTFKVRLLLRRDGRMTTTIEEIPPRLPPARIRLSTSPVDERDPFLFHKTTHRRVYERATAEAGNVDDVVLLNTRGELTESTVANLVVEVDGKLVTPPISSGLLPGVLRGRMLEAGRIEERVLHAVDLDRATAIYLISGVRGWREATLVRDPAKVTA